LKNKVMIYVLCTRLFLAQKDTVLHGRISLDYFEDGLRLCCMCAETNVFAARAASKLNSPAIVAAATTCANFIAFASGVSPPPLHPIAFKQAACAGKPVPYPAVSTSILSIVQLIHKSPSLVSSSIVIQLLLSTF